MDKVNNIKTKRKGRVCNIIKYSDDSVYRVPSDIKNSIGDNTDTETGQASILYSLVFGML